MYYDALRTFIAVVEEGNFTKAAEKRLISQPSVSVHIQNLEKEFETALFIRSPKKLRLTSTGELLYERAKQITQIYEATKEEISQHLHEHQLELKIGASFTIGEYVLPPLLEELFKRNPEIKLEVIIGNTNEIIEYVKLFQVDFGLIEGQCNEKSLHVSPFLKDELKIIGPFQKKKSEEITSIEQLQNRTWVTREKGSGTRAFMEHVLRSHGLKAKNVITISSTQGVKEAVIRGMGFSLISNFAISSELQNQQLSIIPIQDEIFVRKFSYIYSPILKNKKPLEVFRKVLERETI
ncbi:MAG: LysR family transcriptional regulator [Bacillota bacterium]|nr:LysR family transcriptional regulator [Bacillota bacterium]